MPPPLLSLPPGLNWNVRKTPIHSTIIAQHASGRETRTALYAHALYEFEATLEGLDSSGTYPGLGRLSLQTLMGFMMQCRGSWGSFLYVDPADQSVQNQFLGWGDGTTRQFAFQRDFGGVVEPVGYVTKITNVSVAGVAVSSFVATGGNVLTLATPPAAGTAVTASFSYAYLCRFLDDQLDFENVLAGLWSLKSLKFRSIR